MGCGVKGSLKVLGWTFTFPGAGSTSSTLLLPHPRQRLTPPGSGPAVRSPGLGRVRGSPNPAAPCSSPLPCFLCLSLLGSTTPLPAAWPATYSCTGPRWWSRQSRCWCFQDSEYRSSGGSQADRSPWRSGCSGGCWCCSSGLGSTGLQRVQGEAGVGKGLEPRERQTRQTDYAGLGA